MFKSFVTAVKRWTVIAVILVGLPAVICLAAAERSLTIYFIDVEGGQSTLIVTPSGKSALVDSGYAGNGGRDASRILAAARDAGIQKIDYLWTTHFHDDHDGGVVDLMPQLPIGTFIDHGALTPNEQKLPELTNGYAAYAKAREKVQHRQLKPGEVLSLTTQENDEAAVTLTVVSSAGKVIDKPLNRAGDVNSTCGNAPIAPQDDMENPRSTGFLLQFGRFRFLDLGDLTGTPLFSLACPNNRIGPVDVYLVPHHGGPDAADPGTFAAFRPRVAILNNGSTKGGVAEIFSLLHRLSDVDVWQLHRSENKGAENFAADRIANLNETTGYWIKLTADSKGSFRITNGRSGQSQIYP